MCMSPLITRVTLKKISGFQQLLVPILSTPVPLIDLPLCSCPSDLLSALDNIYIASMGDISGTRLCCILLSWIPPVSSAPA